MTTDNARKISRKAGSGRASGARIGIVGFGTVGEANARGFSLLGCRKIEVFDPFRKANGGVRQAGSIRELEECEIIFLCLPTPTFPNGRQDASAIEESVRELSGFRGTLVLRSTVLPGSSRKLLSQFGRNCAVMPEFLREKTALADFLSPERIVIGTLDGRKNPVLSEFLGELFPDVPLLTMSFEEAETAKYVSNAFLATKISFFNSVGRAIPEFTKKARLAVSADSRIGPYGTSPGRPFSGPCLEKDGRALLEKYPSLSILREAFSENERRALSAGKKPKKPARKARRETRRTA